MDKKQYNKYHRPERTGTVEITLRQKWFSEVIVYCKYSIIHVSTDGVLCIVASDGSIYETYAKGEWLHAKVVEWD